MRLPLREQQATAGDIVLLYGDESEALTHPYLARAWAKSGADLRVPAPGQAKKVAILGSLNHVTHELIVHTSPTKRSSDFVAHLAQIDALYGPMPGRAGKPVVLVEDNGPIHVALLSEMLGDDAPGCGVDAHIGNLIEPLTELRIETTHPPKQKRGQHRSSAPTAQDDPND